MRHPPDSLTPIASIDGGLPPDDDALPIGNARQAIEIDVGKLSTPSHIYRFDRSPSTFRVRAALILSLTTVPLKAADAASAGGLTLGAAMLANIAGSR